MRIVHKLYIYIVLCYILVSVIHDTPVKSKMLEWEQKILCSLCLF